MCFIANRTELCREKHSTALYMSFLHDLHDKNAITAPHRFSLHAILNFISIRLVGTVLHMSILAGYPPFARSTLHALVTCKDACKCKVRVMEWPSQTEFFFRDCFQPFQPKSSRTRCSNPSTHPWVGFSFAFLSFQPFHHFFVGWKIDHPLWPNQQQELAKLNVDTAEFLVVSLF